MSKRRYPMVHCPNCHRVAPDDAVRRRAAQLNNRVRFPDMRYSPPLRCRACATRLREKDIITRAARLAVARRKTRAGGRRPKQRSCPDCGEKCWGQKGLREHRRLAHQC